MQFVARKSEDDAISQFCDVTLDEASHESAWDKIRSAERTVSTLIVDAGPWLSGGDDGPRGRAMLLVALALEDGAGSQKEVEALSEFCASKTEDPFCAAPALRCLRSLVKLEAKGRDAAGAVAAGHHAVTTAAKVVFGGVMHVPAHAQKTRQVAWELAEESLRAGKASLETAKAVTEALKSDQGDAGLARGYANAIEGEKDPRCLLRALRCGELVSSFSRSASAQGTLSAGAAEAICEAVGPYFPISFAPPENDQYGVTPEKLRTALRRALCSDPRCSSYALDIASKRCVDDEEDDDADELDEAVRLMARAVETVSSGELASLAAERAGSTLVVGKSRTREGATMDALERLSSRCAAEGCIDALARGVFDNVEGEDGDASYAALDTKEGHFVTKALRACARAGGFVVWRKVYERFGHRVADIVVENFSSDDDVSTETLAALSALVDLLEIPDAELFTGEDDALSQHKDTLLAIFCQSNDSSSREAELLKTRGAAALAEKGRVLDDGDVENSLTTASRRIVAADDVNYLSKLCAATSRAAAARPAAALCASRRIEDPVALASLAASPSVFKSDKLAQAVTQSMELPATARSSYVTRALAESLRLARRTRPVDDYFCDVLAVRLAKAIPKSRSSSSQSYEEDRIDALVSASHESAGVAPRFLAARAAEAYLQRPSPEVARLVEVGLDNDDGEWPIDGPLAMKLCEEAARGDEDENKSALSALVALLARCEPTPDFRDILETRLASSFEDPWWIPAAAAVVARSDLGEALPESVTRTIVDGLLANEQVPLDSLLGLRPRMSKKNHVSRFWRQRLYARIAPRLLGDGANAEKTNPRVAAALVSLARSLPRGAVLARAVDLVDVSLKADTPSLLLVVLDSEDACALLKPKLHVAIPDLLEATSTRPSPRDRVDALRCLEKIARQPLFPHSSLYPFRKQVATALKRPLDDDVRDVRRLAADVRNRWLAVVGGPAV